MRERQVAVRMHGAYKTGGRRREGQRGEEEGDRGRVPMLCAVMPAIPVPVLLQSLSCLSSFLCACVEKVPPSLWQDRRRRGVFVPVPAVCPINVNGSGEGWGKFML